MMPKPDAAPRNVSKRKIQAKKPATMAQIAVACGVSRASVSYVLNNVAEEQGIPADTAGRILKAARKLGYRPNDAARATKTGRTRTLALFTPPLRFESNILVMQGAALAANATGYQLKYIPVPAEGSDAAELIAQCRERLIGGAICLNLPRPLLDELHANASESDFLLAQVGDEFPELGDLSVVTDHSIGTRQVIDHLVALGHQRIALLINNPDYSTSAMRLAGFEQALATHGISTPSCYRRTTYFEADSISREVKALLALKRRPTAIVCDTDPVALTALHTVIAAGLRVPEDISVTGYVNLPFGEFTQPRLTSVEIPNEELGRQVARQLIARLENREPEPVSVPEQRLIVRESCGPAAAE
ncbi:LacI family transcriptional regulator [Opitutaceae bacterium TAV4]|nr:LacI family transcriptional regulator [Opitutaceae bacterium TAV4]RRK02093.1 LacI family transcriptional regulator [Opitutaceae bacterium TAV3]